MKEEKIRLTEEQPDSVDDKTSLFSGIFFCWTLPLIWLGLRRELRQEDIYRLRSKHSTEKLGKALSKTWTHELKRTKPSLKRVLWKTYRVEYLIILILVLIQQCVLRTTIPILVAFLIGCSNGECSAQEIWTFGGLFVLNTFVSSFISHWTVFRLQIIGMRIRISVTSLIYSKVLRLSQTAAELGHLINVITNDLNRFDRVLIWLPYMVVGPVQLIVMIGVLWYYTGPACLPGLAYLILMLPVTAFSGKVVGNFRSKVAAATDRRVRLITEILNGMLLVKMCAWERTFFDKIAEARRIEVNTIKSKSKVETLLVTLLATSTRVSLLLSFATFYLTSRTITPELAFATLAMYNIVSHTTGLFFPAAITGFSEILVSVGRIQKVLLMEENRKDDPEIPELTLTEEMPQAGFFVADLSASWPGSETKVLNDVSLQAGLKDFIGIVGPVGSGKSTLLQAILREVEPDTGSVALKGKVSYCPQEACLFPGSVKDNILLGLPFERVWYETVVEACALTRDLGTLLHADETLVGDKGLNLSGGQKARISLARAVYSRADIYLLDDPLSAVDVRVARHLMDKCIRGLLLDKCVILVTHQTQHLRQANEVVELNHGAISCRGSFTKLCAKNKLEHVDECQTIVDDVMFESESSVPIDGRPTDIKCGYGTFEKQTAQKEATANGAVSWKLYGRYLLSGNSATYVCMVVLLSIAAQFLFTASDWWILVWSSKHGAAFAFPRVGNSSFNTSCDFRNFSDCWYVLLYAGLVLSLMLFSIVRALALFWTLIKSSVVLHERLLFAIMRAPMRFFEVNSVGRLLNRFSNDVGVMDDYLPAVFYVVTYYFVQVLGYIVVIVYTNVVFIFPTLVFMLLIYAMLRVYIPVSSQIKRLEAAGRSPVLEQVSTTMAGISVVRAFGAEKIFVEQLNKFQDVHSSNFHMLLSVGRWFQVWVELLAGAYVSAILVLSFLFPPSSSSAFGLAITSALTISLGLRMFTNNGTEMNTQMVSVERMVEHTTLKSEANLSASGQSLGSAWLRNGQIRFDRVVVAYENGIPALQNISLTIRAGEKIGVVGRTGAGKSTLVASLFRIVEVSSGSIHISGVDIRRIGLSDLRRQLGIIPQSPVLFSGSLRNNLDPCGDYDDTELWTALKAVQLESRIRNNADNNRLELDITEGGANFSHGEKQLICLARAILQRSKIVILDEATANIDTRTDLIIQETLRKIFKASTVLTVAHRLDTVMDSDRILVLDSGHMKEFDEPSKLLRDPESFLYNLVENTGSRNSARLRKTADEAFQRRHLAQ